MRFLLLFSMVLVFHPQASAVDQVKTIKEIRISVGDSRTLATDADVEIEVSRKNIIHIDSLAGGGIQITGLERGFVMISEIKEGTLLTRWNIFVDHSASKKGDRSVCRLVGVVCDSEASSISGTAVKFEDWLDALYWCQEKRDCRFRLGLTHAAAMRLEEEVGKIIGEDGAIKYFPPDQIEYIQRCRKDHATKQAEIKKLLSQHWLRWLILIPKCAARDTVTYIVEASIILVSRELIDQFGFSLGKDGVSTPYLDSKVEVSLLDHIGKSDATIIATPKIHAQVGETARVLSGGEFKVTFASSKSEHSIREGWKKYGVELKATLQDASVSDVTLATELSISNPQFGNDSSLQNHEMSTQMLVNIGRKQLIGVTDLYSLHENETARHLLQKLPIIGPLFRVGGSSDGRRVLLYWVEVNPKNET